MVRVKICGLTNAEDALAAAAFGADALGFVFATSPRQVEPGQVRAIVERLPLFVLTVGVFVDCPVEQVKDIRDFCPLDIVQLHGRETPDMVQALGERVIKGVRVGADRPLPLDEFPSATLLLDTFSPHQAGGTGHTFDWELARGPALRRPIIMAGGLNPNNVIEAINKVRPYAVDVSSGVEAEPGRKDHGKLESFIRRAKSVG
jgi:phosphoribosylanthranilate isomerase